MGVPKRISVAGCPVDQISLDEVVGELCQRIDQRQRTHVIFINAAKVVRCQQSPDLRGAVERADMLLADGVPIVWASRLRRTPLPGRVNGTDLMERMLAVSTERGYSVYLLGARPEVLQRAIGEIQNRYPRLKIAGSRHGYFSEADETTIVRDINESRPDLLLIGMSTPQKELWGDRHLQSLNVPVCQGVGGSFDVLAGLTARAPLWMQHYGLEWFYRLLQEPRRLWRRYLETNCAFVRLVLVDLMASRKNGA
jgi:N-acetylglucosaminyldiphosphoundecaprenol N-acetyl-beta-D-mannosaminyltransferase